MCNMSFDRIGLLNEAVVIIALGNIFSIATFKKIERVSFFQLAYLERDFLDG